jgi:exopolyphosphatase/guanosine-5'-triphosphate,3'-diphosphate pyrophosphatase
VTTGATRLEWATSTEAGSVRLTDRFFHDDPPSETELAACADHVRSLLPPLEVGRAIGVAGTVTTAAAIEADGATTVHRHRVRTEAVAAILERLAALPLAERERVVGLAPARAPVIVAGLVVLHTILEGYGLESIEVSERDLLEGAALAAAELPEPAEGPVPPMAFTCC